MDVVGPAFYAIVCGSLAAAAPSVASRLGRIVVGAVTGLVSALLLPYLRSVIGG
jgi:hypothetical protein